MEGTTSRGGARWRIEPMSGAASTLHNININIAATARGRSGVSHPGGSGDFRQRRHSSRVRPLLRVAPGPIGGVRRGSASRGPHRQQLPTIPRPAQSSPRHR
jgi:hypothetical protein